MHLLTAQKLSIVFGGGIFAVAALGLVASIAGFAVPLIGEGIAALAGMAAGAKVA